VRGRRARRILTRTLVMVFMAISSGNNGVIADSGGSGQINKALLYSRIFEFISKPISVLLYDISNSNLK